MPTVIEVNGIKIKVYKEGRHKFAHVHALKGGCEAKIRLDNFEVYYVEGFSKRDVSRIVDYVKEKQVILLREWEKINAEE